MDPETTGLARATGQDNETITINEPDKKLDVDVAAQITISKIRTKQFIEVFKKIDELADKGVVKLTDENGAFIFSAKGIFTQFSEFKLILHGGDPALDIVSIISGLSRERLDALDLVELAKVVGACWRVNERFFVRNQTELKEALGPIWTIAEKVIEGLQPKPSTPSESTPDSSTSSLPAVTEP